MKPIAVVAGGFTSGVLAMLLLERGVARAQRVMPARQSRRARGDAGSPGDARLRERVRSRLGNWVSHPGAIGVEVENGVVRVSGQVLTHELDGLLSRITGVDGVRKVHNTLEALTDPSGFGEVPQGKSPAVTP